MSNNTCNPKGLVFYSDFTVPDVPAIVNLKIIYHGPHSQLRVKAETRKGFDAMSVDAQRVPTAGIRDFHIASSALVDHLSWKEQMMLAIEMIEEAEKAILVDETNKANPVPKASFGDLLVADWNKRNKGA